MTADLIFETSPQASQLARYDRYVMDHPRGSIYQSLAWLDLVRADYHERILFWNPGSAEPIIAGALLVHRNPIGSFAEVDFGPVCATEDVVLDAVNRIVAFSSTRFHWLRIAFSESLTGTGSAVEETLIHQHGSSLRFEDGWSTLTLDLDKPLDQILRSFRDSTRRHIKKSVANFTLREAVTNEDAATFARLLTTMFTARGIAHSLHGAVEFMQGFLRMIRAHDCGSMYMICDAERVVGAISFLKSGNRYVYFRGATDPEVRNQPVLYAGMWKGIQEAHARPDTSVFDLGGYNLRAIEGDQLFYVNQFKRGFSREVETFARTQVYVFSRARFAAYRAAYPLKTAWERSRLRRQLGRS